MDRSMDSIGSCSLDVDAESSDISDTSGSLNFPTPISIKDITREFTNNIRERCSLQTVKNTTAYVDPVTGQVCIALTQPTTTTATVNNNISGSGIVDSNIQKPLATTATTSTLLTPQTPEDSYDKKPSYLNLACCVNGYSNITTYDSKIRQDINKSREVSPIRPSSTSLQYCKKNNSLAPPVLLAMPNVNIKSPQQQQPTAAAHQMASTNGVYVTSATIGSKYTIENNHSQNGLDGHNTRDEGGGGGGGVGVVKTVHRSFIQQRVERLYGPGALAQGFYSPKKIKDSSTRLNKFNVSENGSDAAATSELARKFQELSPSKDYNQFRKKLSSTNSRPPIPPSTNADATKEDTTTTTKLDNNNIDLPCLRHLSQEFRAQLPVVSPKRNFSRTSPARDTIQPQTHKTVITNGTTTNILTTTTPLLTAVTTNTTTKQIEPQISQQNHHQPSLSSLSPSSSLSILKTCSAITTGSDELDHKIVVSNEVPLHKVVPALEEPKVILPTVANDTQTTNGAGPLSVDVEPIVKDAHFFLKQLKDEQNRLLIMAAEVESYLEALTSNPDISEDILGLLRSASGKARLLVSQKMKQFEGLCHNNLNSSPDDQFPTTVDDLQGFWDMVYLQVDHVDSIFAEIENLKKNDWKKAEEIKTTNVVNVLRTPRNNKTTPLASKSKPPSTPMTNGTGSPSIAALKREAQRKKLQEMKRRNREAMAMAANNVSSTTNETLNIDLVVNNETTTAKATTTNTASATTTTTIGNNNSQANS